MSHRCETCAECPQKVSAGIANTRPVEELLWERGPWESAHLRARVMLRGVEVNWRHLGNSYIQ